jgi:hypothetical protein
LEKQSSPALTQGFSDFYLHSFNNLAATSLELLAPNPQKNIRILSSLHPLFDTFGL